MSDSLKSLMDELTEMVMQPSGSDETRERWLTRVRSKASQIFLMGMDAGEHKTRMDGDHEHIVQLSLEQRRKLMTWLARGSGAHPAGDRVTFESVTGGGILVRTRPYTYKKTSLPADLRT